jgi:hypothetical protein
MDQLCAKHPLAPSEAEVRRAYGSAEEKEVSKYDYDYEHEFVLCTPC